MHQWEVMEANSKIQNSDNAWKSCLSYHIMTVYDTYSRILHNEIVWKSSLAYYITSDNA